MYSDSGPQAPSSATVPKGITTMRAVEVTDPLHPGAGPGLCVRDGRRLEGPEARLQRVPTATSAYLRDPAGSKTPADEYAFSQSDYSNYGKRA